MQRDSASTSFKVNNIISADFDKCSYSYSLNCYYFKS